jgi:hypothetical protein
MPVLIAETPTLTTTNQLTFTNQSPYTESSMISSATTVYSTSIQSPGCGYELVCANFACSVVCWRESTYSYFLFASTTSWQVASTTTYELTSTTTFPSYYPTTSYHTNSVPPYAYYGLSGESFAGVTLVVLILCVVVGFYATRLGKKRGQVKLTQFVTKKPTCVKCGATLPPDSKFCNKCGSAQT